MSELDLRVRRPLRTHTQDEWATWTSECKVLSIMCKKSGLQDKAIAMEIGVEPAILSRVQSGQARLSEQAIDALMDVTGSEALLHYWLIKRGYDPRSLRRIETDLECENRELRERLATIEHEREIELRLISKMRVA